MTLDKFQSIENEVIGIIKDSFCKAIEESTSDFILLLARGGYNELLERSSIDLSPFVIDDRTDFLVDLTRKKFFVKYINDYVSRLVNNKYMSNEEEEFEITIQLMIYSHIWESHLFLNQLERLAMIQLGKGYNWISQLNNSETRKGAFIKNNIINRFERSDNNMAELIKRCYSNNLRNDFAHSTYYISDRKITSNGSYLFSGPTINFEEWEERFVYSMLLSYQINDMLLEYRNQYIDIQGDTPIMIEIPLKGNHNKKGYAYIKPERINGKEEKVRFVFAQNEITNII